METKYTMQTLDKTTGYFDIEIFDEDAARGMLEETLCCETREESAIKAKVIFDEIKKGNSFTKVERGTTRITFRIATENDVKTEPFYRRAEEDFYNNDMTEEEIAQQKALEHLIKETTEEEFEEIFNIIENNKSSTD